MKNALRKRVFKDIESYIFTLPKNVQLILQKLRKVIRHLAPESQETISYGIPTFKLNGESGTFCCIQNHVGFYPTPSAIITFKKN